MIRKRRKREWMPSGLYYIVLIGSTILLLFAYHYFEIKNSPIFQFDEIFTTYRQLLIFLAHAFLWIMGWVSVFFGAIAISLWYESYRKFGIISVEDRDLIKKLVSISKMDRGNKTGRILIFYFGLFGLAFAFILQEWILLFSVALAISIYIWHIIRISRPPMILILSTSNSRNITMFWNFQMLYRPLRTVALLDTESSINDEISADLALDCLRTTNSDDWWEVIQTLFQIVPVIIIDTSAITLGVIREGQKVLELSYEYKCIFLADRNSEYPLLDLIAPSLWRQNLKICCATSDEIVELVDKVLNSNSFPSIDNPIKKICQQWH